MISTVSDPCARHEDMHVSFKTFESGWKLRMCIKQVILIELTIMQLPKIV